MKKLFLIVLLFSILLVGCSSQPPNQGSAFPAVHAIGTGTLKSDPDMVIMTISMVTEGKDKNVQEENAKKTTDVLDALYKLGLEESEISTQGTSFQPVYQWKDGIQEQKGYSAENSLKIETKKIDLAGQIADIAIANGAERTGSPIFSLSDEGKNNILAEAIDEAVLDATNQATAAAQAAGVTISGVQELIVEKESQGYYPFEMARMSGEKDQLTTPIIPGEIQFTVRVKASFTLKK